MDIFHNFVYIPVFNLLVFLYDLFSSNIGLAIIGLALFSRIVTIPLTRNQKQNSGKAQLLQQKMKEIRKKFKHNKEKMAQELARLQAEFLPGQLKGCFSLIISIILLIQVRNVVVDLIDKGVHAYNVVAYSENLKKPEDTVIFKPEQELSLGKHEIKLQVKADNGKALEKVFSFDVVENRQETIEKIKQDELAKDPEERNKTNEALAKQQEAERATDIAVYNELLSKGLTNIPLSSFLIFTTDSVSTILLTEKSLEFVFYVRPPSNQKIIASETRVLLDSQDITGQAQITQGGSFNLSFAGMNLSRVASDITSGSVSEVIPYVILALSVGVTQYFVSKIYSAMNPGAPAPDAKKSQKDEAKKSQDKHKKGHKDEEEPDFSEMMGQSMKNMNYLFPVMTSAMSLGYLGGASLFPSGVSLFWTGQNAFVIIQQVLDNRRKVVLQVKGLWIRIKRKLNLEK
ncbi:MAG TPA: YidC/Oxa1 family membrane protein insertase [Candidatus Dojkabacteria bacterium]|nr:YidC/Oxa1 family membrane protein insertase [Candidatus Dojkabacteria bacterium]